MKYSASDYRDAGFSVDWLKANRDVLAVVEKYISAGKSGEFWSPQRLQQEVEATNWWRKKTEAQRQASILQQEQPGEWSQRVSDARRIAQQLASVMGVPLSQAQINDLGNKGASNGWDQDDFRLAITSKYRGGFSTGDSRNYWDQMSDLEAEYLVKIGRDQKEKFIREMLRGDRQMEDLKAWFTERASGLYQSVKDDLYAGMTTREILDPYLQDAAEELGVTEGAIDAFDARWTAALTGGKDGAALSREEWIAKIRTDKKYGWNDTWKAKNEAANLGRELMTLFGG